MIVRAWRGRAAATNANAYVEHFRNTVLPELDRIDGFRGASLLRKDHGMEVEYVVLSRWASMEAIRAFAGNDVEKAVVEPQAVAALIDFDREVEHYLVAEERSVQGLA
jgi:heme-degrading monooxygenase HmoA